MTTFALSLPLMQGLSELAPSEPDWSRVGVNEKLVVILALSFALLVVAIILATIVVIAIQKAKRNERLVALAIEHKQAEVARELLRPGAPKVVWLVIGLVSIVLIAHLPWFASLVVAIITVATFPAWGPYLLGVEKKESGHRAGARHVPKVTTRIETNVAENKPADADRND